MPQGAKKSRTFRRVFKKTPGNENKIHYEKRMHQKPKCGKCGGALQGIPRDVVRKAKTEKRPSRPYGGVLCSKCARDVHIEKARQND